MVLALAPRKNGIAHWWCRCQCGTICCIQHSHLINHLTRSCGCLQRELIAERSRTHGQSHTREYKVWDTMHQRCSNPKNKSFPEYGGRGIYVAWSCFADFFRDMGPRPGPQYSIERVNNDGPYSKDNCVWATPRAQARNRKSNTIITYNGTTHCLVVWAELLSLRRDTLAWRLKHWPLEQAFTTPLRQ
jgi:hypothetical protein